MAGGLPSVFFHMVTRAALRSRAKMVAEKSDLHTHARTHARKHTHTHTHTHTYTHT